MHRGFQNQNSMRFFRNVELLYNVFTDRNTKGEVDIQYNPSHQMTADFPH